MHTEIPAWILQRRAKGAAAAGEGAEGPPQRRSPTGLVLSQLQCSSALGDFSVSTAESPLITSDLLAFPRNSKALNYMDEPRSPTRVGWSDEPPPPTEEEDGPGPPGAVEHP